MEIRAHSAYRGRRYPIAYWRTSSGFEVDFILGDGAIALEVKSTDNPASDHLKGLRAWRDEQKSKRCLLVCRAARPRRTEDGIEILPWPDFLRELWEDRLVVE